MARGVSHARGKETNGSWFATMLPKVVVCVERGRDAYHKITRVAGVDALCKSREEALKNISIKVIALPRLNLDHLLSPNFPPICNRLRSSHIIDCAFIVGLHRIWQDLVESQQSILIVRDPGMKCDFVVLRGDLSNIIEREAGECFRCQEVGHEARFYPLAGVSTVDQERFITQRSRSPQRGRFQDQQSQWPKPHGMRVNPRSGEFSTIGDEGCRNKFISQGR